MAVDSCEWVTPGKTGNRNYRRKPQGLISNTRADERENKLLFLDCREFCWSPIRHHHRPSADGFIHLTWQLTSGDCSEVVTFCAESSQIRRDVEGVCLNSKGPVGWIWKLWYGLYILRTTHWCIGLNRWEESVLGLTKYATPKLKDFKTTKQQISHLLFWLHVS